MQQNLLVAQLVKKFRRFFRMSKILFLYSRIPLQNHVLGQMCHRFYPIYLRPDVIYILPSTTRFSK